VYYDGLRRESLRLQLLTCVFDLALDLTHDTALWFPQRFSSVVKMISGFGFYANKQPSSVTSAITLRPLRLKSMASVLCFYYSLASAWHSTNLL